MSDSKDPNKAGFWRVVELVRETPQQFAAHTAPFNRRRLRELLDERHGLLHIRDECSDGARRVQAEIGDYLEILRLRLGMESSASGK
jgi:hypothetical protein